MSMPGAEGSTQLMMMWPCHEDLTTLSRVLYYSARVLQRTYSTSYGSYGCR